MAYGLIASASAGSAAGGDITTGAIDTTGASLIPVAVGSNNGAANVVDSKGNLSSMLSNSTTGSVNCRMGYFTPTTVGSGHTFATDNCNGNYPALAAAALSGAAASPYDTENGAGTGSATHLQTGLITPFEDNEVIVSAAGVQNTGTITVDSGMTLQEQVVFASGQHFGVALAYKIQGALAAINPDWGNIGNNPVAARIAAFKAAAAAAAASLFFIPNHRRPAMQGIYTR
jgi:hypothetical protein